MKPPDTPDSLDLPRSLMREMGYALIDRLVDRISGIGDAPAWQGATREEMRRRLTGVDPEAATAFDALLDQLLDDVLPYATRTDHPRFLAFIPSSPTWPGILGDLLASGSSIYPGTWIGSAGYATLELEVLGWFRDWLGYPPESAGLLMSGGSMANLAALATARDARLRVDSGGDGDGRIGGGKGAPPARPYADGVMYTSAEAHSSVARAARVLGFADDRVRILEVDDAFRLPLEPLAAAVARDRAAGLRPFYVVANAGATSTGAVDPLDALADLCAREGLWLHVDAAYGGFAVLTERGRAMLQGLERADSVTLDPHKWLFQPFEVGCLMVRSGEDLDAAFRTGASYLQDAEVAARAHPDEGEVNFGDRGPQLTRSARALKIWLSVRYFGLDRFRTAIGKGMDLADRAEAWIRESGAFEVLSPATLGIVCFAAEGGDAENEARVRRLRESGVGMISSTRIRGRYALRLCIMGHRTTWADVERVLEALAVPAGR